MSTIKGKVLPGWPGGKRRAGRLPVRIAFCVLAIAAAALAGRAPGARRDSGAARVYFPRTLDLYPAWETASRRLEELHRLTGVLPDPGERTACLRAVLDASAILAAERPVAGLFAGRKEIFLLLLAQGIAESGGDPRAVSPQGDLGWAQINVKMLAVLRVRHPFDVAENAAGQARHLRALLLNLEKRWQDTKSSEELLRLALAAYNASSRAVEDGTVPPRLAGYVGRVMRLYAALRAECRAEERRAAAIGIPLRFAGAPGGGLSAPAECSG